MTNLTMYVNILSFPQLQETSTGAAQPSTGQSQEGTGEGEEGVKMNDKWFGFFLSGILTLAAI